MQLEHMIIHKMIKEQNKLEAKLDTSASSWSIQDNVIIDFCEKLKVSFAKSTNAYANIKVEKKEVRDGKEVIVQNNSEMHNLLTEFFDAECLSGELEEFPELSNRCGLIIEDEIKKKRFASGGHIIYIKYTDLGRTYLLVVLMKMTKGYGMDYDESKLIESEIFNMDYFQEGVRVNLNTWAGLNPDVDRCMNFIKRRGDDDVSEYFRDAMGCVDYAESKRNTGLVLDALRDYLEHKLAKVEYSAEEKEQKETLAHDYLWSTLDRGALVKFSEICRIASPVDNDSEVSEMWNHCINHEKERFQQIDEEFECSRDKMKEKLRVSGQVGSSRFTVSAQDIKDKKVEISESDNSVSFKGIDPRAMKKLMRLMK